MLISQGKCVCSKEGAAGEASLDPRKLTEGRGWAWASGEEGDKLPMGLVLGVLSPKDPLVNVGAAQTPISMWLGLLSYKLKLSLVSLAWTPARCYAPETRDAGYDLFWEDFINKTKWKRTVKAGHGGLYL
jgi:hypothetical protein